MHGIFLSQIPGFPGEWEPCYIYGPRSITVTKKIYINRKHISHLETSVKPKNHVGKDKPQQLHSQEIIPKKLHERMICKT